MSDKYHYLQIDEEGFVGANSERLENIDQAHIVLKNIFLKPDNFCIGSKFQDNEIIIEAFDAPYMAHKVSFSDDTWSLLLPYNLKVPFELNTLTLDEWDRFHGLTTTGIPFTMLPEAQNDLFELMDEFDDDSITFQGQSFKTPQWLGQNNSVNGEKFWSDKYISEEKPGWDLDEPATALKDILPQLKLLKSRILVLGCGAGHDAAYLAQQGHIVTAVDISPEALKIAKNRYGDLNNLSFVEADIFNLPNSFNENFDVVFEHTCFCAINPDKRNQLIQIWKNCLDDQGHLLGVFFTRHFPEGPPFGSSEWELRERLKNKFTPIYWTRWRKSITPRLGVEHVIYAKKN